MLTITSVGKRATQLKVHRGFCGDTFLQAVGDWTAIFSFFGNVQPESYLGSFYIYVNVLVTSVCFYFVLRYCSYNSSMVELMTSVKTAPLN